MGTIKKQFIYLFFLIFFSCEEKKESDFDMKILSFREFLVQEKLSLDFNEVNKFETLLLGNKYSNHYFKFSTVLPESFEIDRGNYQYTVIRGFDSNNGITISIGVTPISNLLDSEEIQNIHNSFQNSPLSYLNERYGGDFKREMLGVMRSNTNLKINNFRVGEQKIKSTNYVYILSEYTEKFADLDIKMIKLDYQTILWGNSFGFSYNSPLSLYDEQLIIDVLNHTNYIRP